MTGAFGKDQPLQRHPAAADKEEAMTARLARVLSRPLPFVAINGGILLALEWLVQHRTPAESVAYAAYLLVGSGIGAWVLSRLHRTAHGRRLFALPLKFGYLLSIGIVAGILLVIWNVIQ